MKRWPVLIALVVLVLGLPGGGAAAQNTADPLGADLDRLLVDPRLVGTSVGLVVRDADSGDLLYTRSSADRLVPASNAKLITTATALEVLGADHRFRTDVLASGTRRGHLVNGDLLLRGTGDPTPLAADYHDLAARVRASGVRVVAGDLVADDTWFDAVRLGTGWAWDDEPYYYNAEISALTVSPDTDYDAGTVIVRVLPGAAPGAPARVEVDPPNDHVRIVSTATTAASGGSVSVDRDRASTTIRVSGSLAVGSEPVTQYTAVADPTGLATSIFARALADNGVRVLGKVRRGVTPPDATTLASRESMTLGELLVPLLKFSNNGHSEILVKAAGRAVSGEGTWGAGLAALQAGLPGLGVDPAALRLVDGSGLSRMDVVSPDQIASLLIGARDEPWFGAWYEALPVAGDPDRTRGGTLRNRMRDTPAAGNVRAKTGSLTGVTSLAGYVTAADGRHLVFALILNNFVSSSPHDVEDAIAVRLASDRAGLGGVVLAPRPQADARSGDLECSWSKSC
ncbi:D-alanyl-D-alanine carboxypeptidase/D-alanyl-D-alanine endopeptidase [Umezawaea beigongshangensis]|uniref:D-alanyl-D-alanine carboxypeptidase/D-alanyl-D-alanine endopeptidase n=1 Tax=Umezawaea beigongshangensis TaxID=2780383 RepID=UPI0018F23EED|nr:D-alanyl-D-alanine carboxypeptidase/D-alanyl-D-alanine-endopeptidase [Umezawaea beigongshangensis]